MLITQVRWILVVGLSLTLAACGGRPVEALSAAEKAMEDASLAKTCAPDEYLAAQKLLDKAKALAEEGEHARAKATAIAAEKLAKKAVEKNIKKIYFDRGQFKYHGRVKIFAETLRKNGMEF